MTLKITDITGNKKNGYATYITIETKNIEYNIKCEEDNSEINSNKTALSIVGIYDKIRKTGGYSPEAMGISALIPAFDRDVLKPLRDNHHIQINPL